MNMVEQVSNVARSLSSKTPNFKSSNLSTYPGVTAEIRSRKGTIAGVRWWGDKRGSNSDMVGEMKTNRREEISKGKNYKESYY